VDGIKVQLRVVMEVSTQWERQLFHFLTSYAHDKLFHVLTRLTQEKNYVHRSVSFFNEIEIENKICSLLGWLSKPLFHFLTRLTQKWEPCS
jgi:hypothetical protein